MKRRINGIGKTLPIIHIGIAVRIGTPSIDATRRPPRSSKIGIKEIIKTTASAGIY